MFKRIIAAAFIAAVAISAQAQQQTGILTTQIPLRGAGTGSTFDMASGRYINFASNDAYVIDADGVRINGSMSLSKVQGMADWKHWLAVTPLFYINTQNVRFKCENYQTLIFWAGHAPEARNDNCSLYQKVISQSDTN